MSDTDKREGLIQKCRWHGYYNVNVGCEKCRRAELERKMTGKANKAPMALFEKVVWLEK